MSEQDEALQECWRCQQEPVIPVDGVCWRWVVQWARVDGVSAVVVSKVTCEPAEQRRMEVHAIHWTRGSRDRIKDVVALLDGVGSSLESPLYVINPCEFGVPVREWLQELGHAVFSAMPGIRCDQPDHCRRFMNRGAQGDHAGLQAAKDGRLAVLVPGLADLYAAQACRRQRGFTDLGLRKVSGAQLDLWASVIAAFDAALLLEPG